MIRDELILSDADGVLVDWVSSFENFMNVKYSVKQVRSDTSDLALRFNIDENDMHDLSYHFCTNEYIKFLEPYNDAQKYVSKLHKKHGFKFHVITAIYDYDHVRNFRMDNLKNIFGQDAIHDLTHVGYGNIGLKGDKSSILSSYKDSGCFWMEDSIKNACLGNSLNLQSVLFLDTHNIDESVNLPTEIFKTYTWRDFYEYYF